MIHGRSFITPAGQKRVRERRADYIIKLASNMLPQGTQPETAAAAAPAMLVCIPR